MKDTLGYPYMIWRKCQLFIVSKIIFFYLWWPWGAVWEARGEVPTPSHPAAVIISWDQITQKAPFEEEAAAPTGREVLQVVWISFTWLGDYSSNKVPKMGELQAVATCHVPAGQQCLAFRTDASRGPRFPVRPRLRPWLRIPSSLRPPSLFSLDHLRNSQPSCFPSPDFTDF